MVGPPRRDTSPTPTGRRRARPSQGAGSQARTGAAPKCGRRFPVAARATRPRRSSRSSGRLLRSLYEQAFLLAVVELDDLGIVARRPLVCARDDVREGRLRQQLLREVEREQRASEAVPGHLYDELPADAVRVFVGNEKVGSIAAPVGGDRPVEIGKTETKHSTGLEHATKLAESRHEVGVGKLRKRVNAHGVVDQVAVEGQSGTDVATDVDAVAVVQI